MSEQRIPLATAERLAMRVYDRLKPTCDQIKIGGSIRRRSSIVKDAEIVAIPTAATYRVLEQGIAAGFWSKAEYGNDRTHRWGTWYRGLELREADTVLKVECFFTEGDSFGYQLALRTGSSDVNQFVMYQMQRSDVRCIDGAVWFSRDWSRTAKGEWVSETKRRVIIPDELRWFSMLGLEYIEPQDRTVDAYKKICIAVDSSWLDEPVPQQRKLWG